jgi:RNA polymerase sigma-70 factor, ECF subfamily
MVDAERDRVFERWFDAHKAILFKVARVYGATHSDREDLFQEIALQLWHSVPAYRGDCTATTWIYRVALNTALAWRRKERKHGDGRQDIEAATGLLAVAPRDPRLDWIYERIAELDEANRSLALLMLDGFSYREMSQILGLGESNVTSACGSTGSRRRWPPGWRRRNSVDFDQMLDAWRAQNTTPPYEANREALRQALQAEAARGRRALRHQRRGLWLVGLIGAGMTVWAAFWIAITITNGWPAIYVIASVVSVCIFAFGAVAIWAGRGRLAEPEPHAGNTLQEELRRCLAYADQQLSIARHVLTTMLGVTCLVVGTGLFSWTVTSSQGIRPSAGGWPLFPLLWVAFCMWAAFKSLAGARKGRPTLELRQRRLRDLLSTLDAGE